MKKNDLIILVLVLTAAGVLYLLSQTTNFTTHKTPTQAIAALPLSETDQEPLPDDAQASQQPQDSQHSAATLAPADCYLLVTIGDVVFEPYPMLTETDLPITQVDGQTNTVHISPTGFYMAHASCANQECVHQGEVTLTNRDYRLLGNQVICLPNQVMLQLLSPEEAAIVWGNAHQAQD